MPPAVSWQGWEGDVLRHFMRYRPGWWILHILAVSLTLWLGYSIEF